MPLTPEDVRNKRFTPVRLREGYDMGEVDQFLDEVEAELERLTVENEELRAKVAAASTGEPTGLIPALSSPTPAAATPPAPAVQEPVKAVEPTPAPEPEPAPAPVAAAPAPVAAARPSMGDASSAAARLLEIASTNADQLMDAAKEEADRMVGEARAKAERITNEARGKADRLETDARIRAQKLDEETNERRTAAVATIERDRYEIQREVEHLRAYEREYRARLKNYFQSQLDQLAANESTTASTPVQAPADAAPRRLRSLLGDDENL
ncbi:DivIVA domain-containing protein [Aeromicrobium endophyticum]|uniref:Cell wall synthesis protein Wag31 n=1 Tax=Aeromicrobium endophyticum TaxID=2292704 RepID=A0A371P4P4_9ACTN|nr:DivIVA domain-containing protein [Aeromicrobium endophyticum]REK70396.1 DivIVA domain-containing protein [Aeromicrobium endophyticum]